MKKDRSNKISDEVFSELGKTKRSERQKHETLERLKDAPEKKPIPYSYYISIVSAALIFLLLYLPTFLGTDIGADNEQEVEKQLVESEIFPLEDTTYHLIGIEGRVGFTVDYDGESSNIYANEPFEYDWYFWGEEEDLKSSLKVVGTHESGEESDILLTNNGNPISRYSYVAGYALHGATSYLPMKMEFPKPGFWELDISITNGFSEKIVVYAKERPEGESRKYLIKEQYQLEDYQHASLIGTGQIPVNNPRIEEIIKILNTLEISEITQAKFEEYLSSTQENQDEVFSLRFLDDNTVVSSYINIYFYPNGDVIFNSYYFDMGNNMDQTYEYYISKVEDDSLYQKIVELTSYEQARKAKADEEIRRSCPEWDNQRSYSFNISEDATHPIPCIRPVLGADSQIEISTWHSDELELSYREWNKEVDEQVTVQLLKDSHTLSYGTRGETIKFGVDYEIYYVVSSAVDEDGNHRETMIVANGIMDDEYDFYVGFYDDNNKYTEDEKVEMIEQIIEDLRR